MSTLSSQRLIGSRVHAVTPALTVSQILAWSQEQSSRYVCFADVNLIVQAHQDREFREIINGAALTAPDGVPLVVALRLLGATAVRTCGPDSMPLVLAEAERLDVPVGFYGGTSITLERLLRRVAVEHPDLRVVFAHSPPFRPLTSCEDDEMVSQIAASSARILFVGLGCPKQERWMADHLGRVRAVMLGVGAAFDFYAGTIPRAPLWAQSVGLEWAVRLMTEPSRLWRRYLVHNPRFLFLFAQQLLRGAR